MHFQGSGCGEVGRAVASDTRVLQYKSVHTQILFTINGIKRLELLILFLLFILFLLALLHS